MTRLDAADQLAAMMRVQIASLKQAAGVKEVTKKPPPQGKPQKKADLASLAAERIRGIDPDDPERRQKALRAFLECVFLQELGAELVRDAGFPRMVDHVMQQMQADPQLAEASSQAADALLNSARS